MLYYQSKFSMITIGEWFCRSPLFMQGGNFVSTGRIDIASAVEKLCAPYAEQLGLTLWDVEFKKEGADWILCLYIDKPEGISINDCENMSRLIDEPLDDADIIKTPYRLQVSSLGLDRPLKLQKDFDRYMGEQVEAKFYKALGGKGGKREVSGTLSAYDGENVTLTDEKGEQIVFKRSDAAYICLKIIF